MTSSDKNREVNDTITSKYIVPPGLIKKMYEFHALIQTAKGKPILIFGPTGVGKSLFLDMYKAWYKTEKGAEIPVATLNCSHFEGDLARSELFGHVKGSYSYAHIDKQGWIEVADGGLLILDEIGELSKECQALLLTVIETGEYHRLGESKIKHIKNLQIVGATNRPKKELRPDFWNRFITFTIPPLHKRRADVLYHIASKYPKILKRLHPWEVLIILAHNWPGNVREIDRMIISIETRKRLEENDHELTGSKIEHFQRGNLELGSLDEEETGLSSDNGAILFYDQCHDDLKERLEKRLNAYGVGLSRSNDNFVFCDFEKTDWDFMKWEANEPSSYRISANRIIHNKKMLLAEFKPTESDIKKMKEYEKLFQVRVLSPYPPFLEATETGLLLFCALFFQDWEADHNLMEIREHAIRFAHRPCFLDDKPFLILAKEILELLIARKLPQKMKLHPDCDEYVDNYLKNLSHLNPDIEFLQKMYPTKNQKKEESGVDIFNMTEDEFEEYYYNGLSQRYSVAEATQVLGLKRPQVLYNRVSALKERGINIKFNK